MFLQLSSSLLSDYGLLTIPVDKLSGVGGEVDGGSRIGEQPDEELDDADIDVVKIGDLEEIKSG
ncbi:hypothetical protein ACTXT7_002591 [Hymenolepis weldensis]